MAEPFLRLGDVGLIVERVCADLREFRPKPNGRRSIPPSLSTMAASA
jgi:hypothetical protein